MRYFILALQAVFVLLGTQDVFAKTPPVYKPPSVWKESRELLQLVSLLKLYDVFLEDSPIALKRIGKANDGGYVIAPLAMQCASAILGYGISDDISFEETASILYNKESWGFDGTCNMVFPKDPRCHFLPYCIKGASTQYFPKECTRFSSFEEQLGALGLFGEPIFVKMDIEGGEYDVLPEVLEHAQKITGMVLEIHFTEPHQILQACDLLELLERDFYLIHMHGNNCSPVGFTVSNAYGIIPAVLELTYINKNLVTKAQLKEFQGSPTYLDMPNHAPLRDACFQFK